MKIFKKRATVSKTQFMDTKQDHVNKKTRFLGNIKIAPKLLFSFLLIALLSSLMGGYAVLSLQEVSDSSKEMYTSILLPTRNAAELQKYFLTSGISLRQALIEQDDARINAHVYTSKNSLTQMDNALSSVESLMSKEHVAEFDEFKTALAYYKSAMEDAFEKITDGRKAEITEHLLGYSDLRSAEYDTEKTLQNLVFVITNDAATINSNNNSTAQRVLSFTIYAIIAVFVISVLIGIFISRSFSAPIKKLTERAKKLAMGDTNFEIYGKSSKDEIGQMREAIKTILFSIQNLDRDTNVLIDSAAEGRLSVRADIEKHQGTYRKIVEGINITLDSMIAPIAESAEILAQFSEGNLRTGVEGNFAGDFAIIKNSINNTIATLKGYIMEITQVLDNIANGNLTVSISSEYKGDFLALKKSINKSIESFNSVIRDINLAAEEVALGATQLSSGSQIISQGTTEQASALEELNASISEISEKIKANAKNAAESNDLSEQAMENAASGNEKMKQLQNAMSEILNSSASISKIIKIIDGIAFQTNILALNAAVEAARAGVHGKGFAVVAEEVRNLAARSAKAAKETAELIEVSMSKTEAGTIISDETAAALDSIIMDIQKTVGLSAEIAEASNEQATGIMQVDKGIEQLSEVVQSSSAAAEQAAASSQELAAQSEHLKQMASRFQFQAGEEIAELSKKSHEYGDKQVLAAKEANEQIAESIVLNDDDFGKL